MRRKLALVKSTSAAPATVVRIGVTDLATDAIASAAAAAAPVLPLTACALRDTGGTRGPAPAIEESVRTSKGPSVQGTPREG